MYILNGIFPVFKPSGLTSAQTLNKIKAIIFKELPTIFEEQLKFGHGGILDFPATGVLVVGAGDDCARLKGFLAGEKSYTFEAVLGTATTTYNAEGEVTMERSFDHIDFEAMKKVTKTFLGRIHQVPPAYSALKVKGQTYADLTRKGVKFKRVSRTVQCFHINIVDFSPPSFSLYVTCGAGFYIRSLVHDIGLALDSCAHLTKLERTCQGPFTLDSALKEVDWSFCNVRDSIVKNRKLVNEYLAESRTW